jgi:hypothetical protein
MRHKAKDKFVGLAIVGVDIIAELPTFPLRFDFNDTVFLGTRERPHEKIGIASCVGTKIDVIGCDSEIHAGPVDGSKCS